LQTNTKSGKNFVYFLKKGKKKTAEAFLSPSVFWFFSFRHDRDDKVIFSQSLLCCPLPECGALKMIYQLVFQRKSWKKHVQEIFFFGWSGISAFLVFWKVKSKQETFYFASQT
jgi:hypothetical protein